MVQDFTDDVRQVNVGQGGIISIVTKPLVIVRGCQTRKKRKTTVKAEAHNRVKYSLIKSYHKED